MISLMPFIGQNLGAGKPERAEESVKKASYAGILFMVFFAAVWFFAPLALFSPFTSDPQILSTGAAYFRIISLGYVFLGLNFILGGAMQAAGRTDLQLTVNFTRWVFIIAFAYAFSAMFGLEGVWMGFPVGNLVGFLIAFAFIKSGYWLKRWREKPDVVRDSAEISPV
jgi:Na+-driven multidrug efflux pump